MAACPSLLLEITGFLRAFDMPSAQGLVNFLIVVTVNSQQWSLVRGASVLLTFFLAFWRLKELTLGLPRVPWAPLELWSSFLESWQFIVLSQGLPRDPLDPPGDSSMISDLHGWHAARTLLGLIEKERRKKERERANNHSAHNLVDQDTPANMLYVHLRAQ